MYPGWLEATMGGSSEDDLREICWLSSCCESNWAADGTLTLGYALTHPDFCTQGEVRYVKVVAWTAEAGSFWTTTASPSTGPCHLSPLLSEQRESQCLPKTTSILSPCRQTKSVLFGCREWLPLIRRTCWGWRCQLFSYNGKKKIRISNDLLLQNNNKTNQKKKTPTCIGWQMRLRVGVSPGLVFSGRRLSSRPSNIPLSLLLLSLGPQLKNEWELNWRRAAMVRECARGTCVRL